MSRLFYVTIITLCHLSTFAQTGENHDILTYSTTIEVNIQQKQVKGKTIIDLLRNPVTNQLILRVVRENPKSAIK